MIGSNGAERVSVLHCIFLRRRRSAAASISQFYRVTTSHIKQAVLFHHVHQREPSVAASRRRMNITLPCKSKICLLNLTIEVALLETFVSYAAGHVSKHQKNSVSKAHGF